MESNADAPFEQNDPFGENFFLLPFEEETRLRAEQQLQDNRDALRHFVDVLGWETFDYPEIRRFLIPLLWHWGDIDPSWVAEACSMSVRNVCEIAESESLMTFNCLDCGRELRLGSRQQVLALHRRLEAFCEEQTNEHHVALLCDTCRNAWNERAKEQQCLDQLRQQAIIREYRKASYAERRQTDEWGILRKRIFRRDGYRCRMCNCNDLPLHLHHRTYGNYAEEKLEELITLCAECHRFFHSVSKVS